MRVLRNDRKGDGCFGLDRASQEESECFMGRLEEVQMLKNERGVAVLAVVFIGLFAALSSFLVGKAAQKKADAKYVSARGSVTTTTVPVVPEGEFR